MKHVKWKSLALYTLTIVAVMVLLKAISIYGESNLKAAFEISDRFHMLDKNNLAG